MENGPQNSDNSGVISVVATSIAAIIALWIYLKQKNDNKRQSAKALYSEIVQFEKIAREIQAEKIKNPNPLIDPDKYFIGGPRWETVKDQFIDDFDPDQWERLETFFSQKEIFIRTTNEIRLIPTKNTDERTKILHSSLGNLLIRYIDEQYSIKTDKDDDDQKLKKLSESEKKFDNMTSMLIETFAVKNKFSYIYSPQGAYSFINSGIEMVDTNLSTGVIGQTLKGIANPKRHWLLSWLFNRLNAVT